MLPPTISDPRRRARLARQYGCLTGFGVVVGGFLLVAAGVVAFGVGVDDPATPSDGPGGTTGRVVKVVLATVAGLCFFVLMPRLMRRYRRRWSASVGSQPSAVVPATVGHRIVGSRTLHVAVLVMPDGERWTVELVKGTPQRERPQVGDTVVVEIYPVEAGECVGAFRVERTGATWDYTADRLPARLTARSRPIGRLPPRS